jgi:hypothetical protein
MLSGHSETMLSRSKVSTKSSEFNETLVNRNLTVVDRRAATVPELIAMICAAAAGRWLSEAV